jgi:microsomal dipeptidase-like Zn-dependent dipeptidase
VSKYLSVSFAQIGQVFSDALVVIASESWAEFSAIQSNIHEAWTRQYSSTLEMRLRYTPTDSYETFPLPEVEPQAELDVIGETYHEHRRQIMLARQEGLTATYNRFHNPDERSADIARLRELHVAMDRVVAAAYGWDDLALGHDFDETAQGLRFTIDEAARREVLGRLLELNHQRYAEEVAMGLHEARTTKARSGAKARSAKGAKGSAAGDGGQMSLL